MPEIVAAIAAGNLSALATVYWVCLIVGGGLLVISALSGTDSGADADAGSALDSDISTDIHAEVDSDGALHAGTDTDVGTDLAHAAHGGHAALSTWFSIRFMVFFMAVFGALGVILTHLTRTGLGWSLAIAVGGGLVAGQAVHQLLRALRRTSGDSTPQPEDYVNKLARVTVGVVPPHKGEVALNVRGGERYVPAVAVRSDAKFEVGEQVVVVAYRGGLAEVVSRAQHESMTR